MIKFLPLDILGVSHRILRKHQNAVYRLQISALVPEIFLKFEKFEKCANKITDDVIHSTQHENGTPKVARKSLNIGEVWNPVCCHGNKTLKLKL